MVDEPIPFSLHLEELRKRLMIAGGSSGCWHFAPATALPNRSSCIYRNRCGRLKRTIRTRRKENGNTDFILEAPVKIGPLHMPEKSAGGRVVPVARRLDVTKGCR